MKTIITVQGKNLRDISSINRRILALLGSLRTVTTNFISCCIYLGTLSEKEKDNLSKEFGNDYILSFTETEDITEDIVENNRMYISSKM